MKARGALAGAVWPTARPAARRMYFFCQFLRAAGEPGVAPAGDLLFFASPKKRKQKKGDPQSGSPSGQPAVLEASGVWLNSLRSNNASPHPLASALLGPARTGGGQNRDKYAPWRVLIGFGDSDVWVRGCSDFRTPRRNEEASSASADESGLALSEPSEFSQTPAGLSNAAYRRSRATNPARLFFAYFLLAKQKKVSAQSGAQPDLQHPPGRVPACQYNKTAKNRKHAAWARHPAPHRPGEKK